MTKEQIERIRSIEDPNKEIQTIYALLDETGIKYKKTTCWRCRRDLLNILREEAGIIGNAADESDFNSNNVEYVYNLDKTMTWNGHLINNGTPIEVIREFIKAYPNAYTAFKKENNNKDTNTKENE